MFSDFIFILYIALHAVNVILSKGKDFAAQIPIVHFSLPNAANTALRALQINTIRQNFRYGPDIIEGEGVYYPTGSYADQLIYFDQATFFAEQTPWTEACISEGINAAQAIAESGGLQSLQDWFKFYDSFERTVPSGPYPGMLSNGTDDLLFSMERLSTAPFGLRRLKPDSIMSFLVDDTIAMSLSTMTQSELLASNRLFYIDYRDQESLHLTAGRYAAASEAFFFLHPSSEFLPLAIRLNRGSNLIYTPLDDINDWLFAKLAFNMNDLWYQQFYHLETTHALIDLVFQAAVRSLHPSHPVYGIMDRLAYQTFAFRLSATRTLVNKDGPVDRLFFADGVNAASYAGYLYRTGAGDWQNTRFLHDLQSRGLLESPPIQHFPYFEDGVKISASIDSFMVKFVNSYYSSDEDVRNDPELANFIRETSSAKVINFQSIRTRKELIQFLEHFAIKASVVHGVSNGNDPVKSTASLPYHPMAFYQPLPTGKGITNLIPFMPNITQSSGQIALLAAFNRPFISDSHIAGSGRILAEMFDAAPFLDRTNTKTQQANQDFKTEMVNFGRIIQRRNFDDNGLSQGMPFVWTALDPLNTPFYLTV